MLDHIVAQMNATLQPGDEPFTLADAEQHVRDYNAWTDALKPVVCDCGKWHDFDKLNPADFKFELNCGNGTYTCRECLAHRHRAERKRKEVEYELLKLEIEYFRDPINMFREFLKAGRPLGTEVRS